MAYTYSNAVFMNAGGTAIDAIRSDGARVTLASTDPATAADFAAVKAATPAPAPYAPPAPPTGAALAQLAAMLANQTIEIGYVGKRVSLYGYLGQLNAYAAAGTITADQKTDLATLIAAAEWEQLVLNAAAAATSPTVAWPAPPAALAALAALS
jgi:hypothetical protein